MTPVEPVLADLCRQLNRMGKSLTVADFLALANDLIKDKPIEAEVLNFKRKICGSNEIETAELGVKYFSNFMKRHRDVLHTTKVVKKDIKRLEWTNYKNISKMYNLLYQLMIEAVVARRLSEKVCFDRGGNIVTEEDIVGLRSDVEVVHPQYILFVDETGSNTNMRKDGQRGRRRVIAEAGCDGHQDSITTDIRYTTLGFTAASGEPVLCVLIFTSENEKGIPSSWISGLDITKITNELEVLDDNAFMETIGREGQVACGGPVCTFRGKTVQTLVQSSPHGGITGPILTNCLKYIDDLELLPRSGGVKPFLLQDGHDSRFHVGFLEYIRNEDHPWIVGFGVPYATHIWQVGDSKEQNGSYKRMEGEAKDILAIEKKKRGLPQVFKPTDIVPIVNYAWNSSFAKKESNRNAIFERGWNPCNYNLLDKNS
jgi:hypothetical protein